MQNCFGFDHAAFDAMTAGGGIQSALVRQYCRRLVSHGEVSRILSNMNERESEQPFCSAALKTLGITLSVDERQLAAIPRSGPVVMVSNHPFGAIEGIAMIALIEGIRADVKVIANGVLRIFPDLAKKCIFVNPFTSKEAQRENVSAVRAAYDWVAQGGLLVVFPAGEVSHFFLRHRRVTDPVWRDTAARIALRAAASVVPLYFCGTNSLRFHIAGLFHPRLRTALLPSELFNKRNRTLHLEIGTPIPYRKIKAFSSASALSRYMRTRTYALAGRVDGSREKSTATAPRTAIVAPMNPAEVMRELTSLAPERCIVAHKQMRVYWAQAQEIPVGMNELGRLREETYRAAGEGTGNAIDLDDYDIYYRHLILVDHDAGRIAGAYRLGPVDDIVAAHGFEGLYTHSLFRFSAKMRQKLSSALELGRSFLCAEYQRRPLSLALLWKGIAQYIYQHPKHRLLFGPVSISAEYGEASMQLLMAYFENQLTNPGEGRLIRPKNPVRHRRLKSWDIDSVVQGLLDEDDLSTIISELEPDAKGVPVLIKQYLNLHGKILAFNLDETFSNVVDGLIVVDLLDTPVEILKRFMGAENAQRFLRHHYGIGNDLRVA